MTGDDVECIHLCIHSWDTTIYIIFSKNDMMMMHIMHVSICCNACITRMLSFTYFFHPLENRNATMKSVLFCLGSFARNM